MPVLQLPNAASARQITAELAMLCRARQWSEVDVTMALAQLLGHMAATLDLQAGTRTFDDRAGGFVGVMEETYKRSILRARPGPPPFRG